MSRRNDLILAVLLLTASAPVMAQQQTNTGAAQQSAVWLNLPLNARAAGMGNAFGALGGDIGSLGINPAGISRLSNPEVFAMYDSWFQDVAVERLSGGLPLGQGSAAGFSVDYLNLGSVDSYSIGPGNSLVANGTLSPNSWDASAAYALSLNNTFSAGVALRYIQQNLGGTPTGTVAGDFGLLAKFILPRFSLGASLLNLGGTLDGDSLPTLVKTSAAYESVVFTGGHQFNVDVDVDIPVAQADTITMDMGVEYWYHHFLAVRVGQQVSDNRASGSNGTPNNGLTLGMGLKLEKISLDYAFLTNGVLGNSNLFSIMAEF
jgi:hypothetical protein